MDNDQISFVTRVREVARHEVINVYKLPKEKGINNLLIISDEKVFLFDKKNKRSNAFRLIKTINEDKKPYWFLTNLFEEDVHNIIMIYKKQWDIEVFFQFIKQELSFKHFISTSLNGIKIILYMTLILSMLILLYKKINEIGYKTAKRRFYYEIEELYMSIIIKLCGGDPNIVFR